MNKKNIIPHNKDGKEHGYWERYHHNGKLFYKGYWNNGNVFGYWEYYWFDKNEIRIFI